MAVPDPERRGRAVSDLGIKPAWQGGEIQLLTQKNKTTYQNAKERDLRRFPRGRHARRVSTTNYQKPFFSFS